MKENAIDVRGASWRAYDILDLLREKAGYEPDIPVDPVKIASMLGIRVAFVHSPFMKEHAVAKSENGKFSIEINMSKTGYDTKRKNYAVGHCLGHVCLHIAKDAANADYLFAENSDTLKPNPIFDPKEYEAFSFARQILMPGHLIKREIERFYEENAEKLGITADNFDWKFKDTLPELHRFLSGRFLLEEKIVETRLRNVIGDIAAKKTPSATDPSP